MDWEDDVPQRSGSKRGRGHFEGEDSGAEDDGLSEFPPQFGEREREGEGYFPNLTFDLLI